MKKGFINVDKLLLNFYIWITPKLFVCCVEWWIYILYLFRTQTLPLWTILFLCQSKSLFYIWNISPFTLKCLLCTPPKELRSHTGFSILLKISQCLQLLMLNLKKLVEIKSTIESKMSVPAGIRTHDLRLTVAIKQNLVAVLDNINNLYIEMLLN